MSSPPSPSLQAPPPWTALPSRSPYQFMAPSRSSPSLGRKRTVVEGFKNKHIARLHEEYKLPGNLARPQSQSALVMLGDDDESWMEVMKSSSSTNDSDESDQWIAPNPRYSSYTMQNLNQLDECLLLWMSKLTVTPENSRPSTPTRRSSFSSIHTLTAINSQLQGIAGVSSASLWTPPPSSPSSSSSSLSQTQDEDWEFISQNCPSVATQPLASQFAILQPKPFVGPRRLRKSKSGFAHVWRRNGGGKKMKRESERFSKEEKGKGKADDDYVSS